MSITVLRSSPRPRLRIVCFPHAGASVSAFRSWPAGLGGDAEIAVVHLPGRYDRMGQRPFRSILEAAGPLADTAATASELPITLFGHSLGALLAFEVARALPRDMVRLLVVSGAAAPHMTQAADPIAKLPDDEFIEQVRMLGATPDEVFANPELVALVLPTLRADFAMVEEYRYHPATPLACPILVLGGDHDQFASEQELLGWGVHTTSSARIEMLPGDHFFINRKLSSVLFSIRRAMYDACSITPGEPPLSSRPLARAAAQQAVVMTKGLPATGKTTWARAEVERQNDRPIRISLDDLRQMFFDRRYSPEGEAFVAAARNALIQVALAHGRDVIIDATNLDPAHEEDVRAVVQRYPQARLDIADFTSAPLETCIRRDHSRDRPVGEAVIRDLFHKYIRHTDDGLGLQWPYSKLVAEREEISSNNRRESRGGR